MITTFDVITELGTGDPKMLSGGISEALVTTELGLGLLQGAGHLVGPAVGFEIHEVAGALLAILPPVVGVGGVVADVRLAPCEPDAGFRGEGAQGEGRDRPVALVTPGPEGG